MEGWSRAGKGSDRGGNGQNGPRRVRIGSASACRVLSPFPGLICQYGSMLTCASDIAGAGLSSPVAAAGPYARARGQKGAKAVMARCMGRIGLLNLQVPEWNFFIVLTLNTIFKFSPHFPLSMYSNITNDYVLSMLQPTKRSSSAHCSIWVQCYPQ